MGILRTDRVSGLGGANAIKGSVYFNDLMEVVYLHQFKIDRSALTFGTGDFTTEFWFYNRIGGYTTNYGRYHFDMVLYMV